MTTAALPVHGTLTRRKTHKCGCEPCLARDREYQSTRYRLIAYGRWQPLVDAEPVRAHVRMLMSYGIGWQRAARLAGVSTGGMSKLLYGDTKRHLAPTKRVRTTTADKILTVRPTLDNLAPSTRVDGTGTRRRLQALVATGWPQMRIAHRMGTNNRIVWTQIRRDVVEVATARNARRVYDELWDADPAAAGVHDRYIQQARSIAARHGWPPPAAWDDGYIDSPAAAPDLGEEPGRYEAIAEDARWLMGTQGYTREQAAHRLGITKRHLGRALAECRAEQGEVA